MPTTPIISNSGSSHPFGDDDWLEQLTNAISSIEDSDISPLDSGYLLKKSFVKERDSKRTVICNCFVCKNPIQDGDLAYRYGGRTEGNERNKIYCGNCAKLFVRCCICNASFTKEELFMDHCPYCVDESPSRLIRNYSTKVHREIPRLGHTNDGLYLGVEVEYECPKDYGRNTLVTNSLIKGFALLKKDSSIKQGFEVVSAPGSIDEHSRHFKSLFEKLPRTVCPDETCGMHVHVSRVRLSDLQIGKMLSFIHNPENNRYVTAIAGRGSSFHNDFKRPKRLGEALYGGKNQENKDRHTALNLNNADTIEFRIFASTKDHYIFMKNLEFCLALVKFSDWARYSIPQAKSFKAFYAFVLVNRKEYPNLWKFLTTAKIFDTLR